MGTSWGTCQPRVQVWPNPGSRGARSCQALGKLRHGQGSNPLPHLHRHCMPGSQLTRCSAHGAAGTGLGCNEVCKGSAVGKRWLLWEVGLLQPEPVCPGHVTWSRAWHRAPPRGLTPDNPPLTSPDPRPPLRPIPIMASCRSKGGWTWPPAGRNLLGRSRLSWGGPGGVGEPSRFPGGRPARDPDAWPPPGPERSQPGNQPQTCN